MPHLVMTIAVAFITSWSQPSRVTAAQDQHAQSAKAIFRLEVIGPVESPSLQVTMREGEEGIVEIKDVGRFGLTPRSGKDGRVVIVTISDLSNGRGGVIGEIAVPMDKQVVTSGTKPSFGIRVLGVKR